MAQSPLRAADDLGPPPPTAAGLSLMVNPRGGGAPTRHLMRSRIRIGFFSVAKMKKLPPRSEESSRPTRCERVGGSRAARICLKRRAFGAVDVRESRQSALFHRDCDSGRINKRMLVDWLATVTASSKRPPETIATKMPMTEGRLGALNAWGRALPRKREKFVLDTNTALDLVLGGSLGGRWRASENQRQPPACRRAAPAGPPSVFARAISENFGMRRDGREFDNS